MDASHGRTVRAPSANVPSLVFAPGQNLLKSAARPLPPLFLHASMLFMMRSEAFPAATDSPRSRHAAAFRNAVVALIVLAFFIGSIPMHRVGGQESETSERERVTAERFMQVLKRRPRPGTALDRVYGFHVQGGSLDDFLASLDVPDDADDAGSMRMILGLLHLQRGKPAEAAKAFTKAEQLLPDDYACSYFLGKSLLAVGQTEKAAEAIERAIEKQPARAEALPIFTELGRIYGRAGQSEKALEVWKKLEALFPGDVRVGGQIAATLAEEGNLDEALRRYERLSDTARKDDDKVSFAVQAAETRRRLGQTEACTEALEKILSRLRPGSWLYNDVRSRIEEGFLRSGDYGALADYYKKKLADSPDNLALQVRLGRVLVSARRLDEAAETLDAAVTRAPDDPDVRLALIDVLVRKGDRAGAAKQYEQLVETDADNPDYLLQWGQLLLDDEKQSLSQRREAAAKVWKRLTEARSDDAVTLSQIADRMRGIDREEDAIELYRKAIEVDPTSPQYREYLGEYLFRLDRKEEAIEVWTSIAEGDRRNRDSLVRLAEVFGTFKEDEKALDAWREAAKLDLTFPQELRFSQKLRDGKLYDEAVERLDAAQKIAETPDEREQLLKARIETYQQAGTLADQIAKLQKAESTADNLRTLAMMHSAAGQLTDAATAIGKARKIDPDDPGVLLVAAEIAERQDRFSDAVESFQQLAKIDTRFQTNYLQRVADLQMRLGEVDKAMETCGLLIDANPASPESYQFLARLAFRAGRDDEAITALRRAMNVAPRDNAPRRMLASAFADRYRTEEAIELYWQAMRYETEADGKINLVARLAPLYDRKADMNQLIRRIEDLARDDIDSRTVQLMISTAHETVRDYGAARSAIDRLLADQPRDVALLETMVRLCDTADDVAAAAEFQDRIVALADTPENRYKLVQLQFDAELIDLSTLLSRRISLGADPERLGMMVRSAKRRDDLTSSIAICEEAIRHDSSLWDIKVTLAQLLLHKQPDADDAGVKEGEYSEPHRRAIALADEIRDLDFPLNARPPTAAKRRTVPGSTSVRTLSTNPRSWSNSSYTLARTYRIGRYASSSYSSSSPRYSTVDPSSFGHARVLATAVKMIAIAKRYAGDESTKKIQALIDDELDLPPPAEIKNANLLWERRALNSIANYFQPSGVAPPASKEKQKFEEQLTWRLAELDPKNGATYLRTTLKSRAQAELNRIDNGQDQEKSGEREAVLSDDQLSLVMKVFRDAQAEKENNSGTRVPWTTLADYRTILSAHFKASGDATRAAEFAIQTPGKDASIGELINAMSYFLALNQVERADALVERLLPAVRSDTSGARLTTSSISGTAGRLNTSGSQGAKFVEKHRLKLLDAVLAAAIKSARSTSRRSTSLSNGTLSTYVRNTRGSYYSFEVKAPLSTALLERQVVNELSSLMPVSESNGQPSGLKISDEVLVHLDQPVEGAPAYEKKSRGVLAAFAYWWMKQPEECYERLVKLCEEFPDDVDLQIERARLAKRARAATCRAAGARFV